MPTLASTTYGLIVSADDAPGGVASIPLTGVDVHTRITGACARVQIRQSYKNDTEAPLEAVYVFPLEESGALCGFRMTIDDHVLHGKVQSRDDAFDQYDDAMAEGKTALLLDQERADIFTVSVGNLLPQQELTIELEYVTEVPREGDALRWRLPTTVSPRYVPESSRDFEGMNDAERISPPVTSEPLPYQMKLVVEADLGTPLQSVESPSHKTRVEMDGSTARVELAGDEGLMDRDFVLLMRPKDHVVPLTAVEEGPDGQRYAAVSFLPEFDAPRDPAELVFVVDCSGSMHGNSIEQARKTLRLCLRSLEKGDHFNVIRFGSSFELYEKQSLAYDDESMQKADEWLQKMDADLGGTEMAAPLGAAYRLPPIGGVSRRIVLITDGQVSNEDDIIHLATQHASDVQVFAFGVGYGASEHLVRGAARAGRGAAEMVYPGENIDDKVMRHFHRMTGRALSDVALSFEGVDIADLLPRTMPPLWANEPVTFYLRVTDGESGSATLSARIENRELRFEAPLEKPGQMAGAAPVLWARERIRELEESDPWTLRRGSLQSGRKAKKIEKESTKLEQQLVEIGQTFGLVSAATSYVLIDDRPEAELADTRARLVRVPGQLTRGWHGLPHMMARTMGAMSLDDADMMMSAPVSLGLSSGAMDFGPSKGVVKASKPAPPSDPLDALALQITADGYWRHSPEVYKVIGLTKAQAVELAEELSLPNAEELVVTLAILVMLEHRRDNIPSEWRLLLKKAWKWVHRVTDELSPPSEVDWSRWMRSRFQP